MTPRYGRLAASLLVSLLIVGAVTLTLIPRAFAAPTDGRTPGPTPAAVIPALAPMQPRDTTPTPRPTTSQQSTQTPVVPVKTVGTQAGSKVVYLTFDDGPSGYTPAVLRLLAAYNAKATFFVIGSQASANPSTIRSIRAAGHAVANHTWSHPSLTGLSASAITSQLSRTDAALGFTAKCVRPPYGATNSTVARTISGMGKKSVLWSVDPQDWARPGSSTIANRILSTVRPGSIVLMHDGGGDRSQTVAALSTVLSSLKAKGYTFAAVPGC